MWYEVNLRLAVGESEANWATFFSNVYCAHTIHIGKMNNCIYESFCCLFLLRNIHK